MPKYRPVHTKIWKDKDFQNSGKDAKLLFFYLITNESINNSGIYEIPIKTIAMETGITVSMIGQLLGNDSIKNIKFDKENEIVFVVNVRKYCKTGNPVQVEKGIISEFELTKKTPLWKRFVELNPYYKSKLSIIDQSLTNDSLPLPLDSKDLNNNKPLKIENYKKVEKEILEYLNKKAGKNYKPVAANLENISARLGEGYNQKDFERVIDCKTAQWKGSEKWDKFLRPATLFGPKKFPGYANELLPAGREIPQDVESPAPEPAKRVVKDQELEDLWNGAREKIRAQIASNEYGTWFEKTAPRFLEAGVLTIAVANQYSRKCLTENYRELIESALMAVAGKPVLVEFCIDPEYATADVSE